jgi:replicative DNA helicase
MSAVLRTDPLSPEERHQVGLDDDIPSDRAIAQLRVPPHSIEAESSVLGGLLLQADAWDRVGDLLTDSDFYRYEHRLIYAVIGALVNATKPADVITVYEQLQVQGKAEEIGGLAYLNSLAQYVPSAANIRRYAEIVRERSILRQLVSASDEIATAAFNTQGRDVEQIVDEAEAKILRVSQIRDASDDEFKPMDFYVKRAIERIDHIIENPDDNSDFVPTGIGAWDELMDGGMRGGELHVVAARPGHGKSAKLLTTAANVARFKRAGKTLGDVAIYSMEMPGLQWANRALAMTGRVHLSKIKRPERLRNEDWPGITEGLEALRQMGIHINDRPGLTINQVRSSARRLSRRTKLALIGVDYLGLMRGTDPKMLRAYQIEEITQGLKNLAKELGIPVMLLVQLKRSVDERADHMPTLGDLSDGSSIEKDADTITFVHRPIKAKPDLAEEWRFYARGYMAKGRDSEGGFFDEYYDGPRLHFSDWPTDLPVPSSKVRTSQGKNL